MVVRVQRVSHKPHDAPSLAYQRPLANPHRALAYKRPFRPFLEVQPGCSITLDGGFSPQDSYADLIFLLQSAITLPVFKCSTGQVPIRIERSPLSLQPGYSRTPDGGGGCHKQIWWPLHYADWRPGVRGNARCTKPCAAKAHLPIRIKGWPTRGRQTFPGSLLRGTEHGRTNTFVARYLCGFDFFIQPAITLPVFKCSMGQVPIRIERSPLSLQPGYYRTPDGGGCYRWPLIPNLCQVHNKYHI